MQNFNKGDNMAMGSTLRGEVSGVDDAKKMREVQVQALEDELLDEVEHFEPYGFTSHPLTGAEVVLGSLGGDRSHSIALIVADRRYRITSTKPGEVVIFTDEGDYIHFKRNNTIDVSTKILNVDAADEINVKSTTIQVNADDVTYTCKNFMVDADSITLKSKSSGDGAGTKFEGNIDVNGYVHADNDVKAGNISLQNHIHKGDDGGDTSKPVG